MTQSLEIPSQKLQLVIKFTPGRFFPTGAAMRRKTRQVRKHQKTKTAANTTRRGRTPDWCIWRSTAAQLYERHYIRHGDALCVCCMRVQAHTGCNCCINVVQIYNPFGWPAFAVNISKYKSKKTKVLTLPAGTVFDVVVQLDAFYFCFDQSSRLYFCSFAELFHESFEDGITCQHRSDTGRLNFKTLIEFDWKTNFFWDSLNELVAPYLTTRGCCLTLYMSILPIL